MEKIEFKSQVCTTKKQSQKLLQLGLRESTADCHWFYHLPTSTWRIIARPYDGIGTYYPAWSLHRLMGMLGSNYDFFCLQNAYEELIEAIALDIKNSWFDKKYLEEEKNEKED